MATLQDLANYIMQMEGYNVGGSLAQRNNNPGNLRSSPFQSGTSNGYATFATSQDGYNALIWQLQQYQNQGLTLQQTIYKYAPPSENNSSQYLGFVSNGIGVDPGTPLSQLGDSTGGSTGVSDVYQQVPTVSSELASVLTGGNSLDLASFGGSDSNSLVSFSGGVDWGMVALVGVGVIIVAKVL